MSIGMSLKLFSYYFAENRRGKSVCMFTQYGVVRLELNDKPTLGHIKSLKSIIQDEYTRLCCVHYFATLTQLISVVV